MTLNEGIIFSYDDMRQGESINCCTSEEADARLIRHAITRSKNSIRQIVIKIEDTDVLMLAIAYIILMTGNGATNVFVEFVGKHQKWYIGKLIDIIDKRNAQGFPYFHSFTGCDTSSSFFNHGKCQFWDT